MDLKEFRKPYFSLIAKEVGGGIGLDIADALDDLYSLHSPDMIDWFARLYNPTVGGWYYSNGARDFGTVVWQEKEWELRPDIESTEQALRFITDSGLAGRIGESNFTNVIPDDMKAKILYFLKSLQHPNGFFYHPQWGVELTDQKLSRRARDLGNAVSVIKLLGDAPTYDTPIGDPGNGILANGERVELVKRESTASEDAPAIAIPEHMKNRKVFIDYLDSLDVRNKSYSAGNTLTAQKRQILFRDQALRAEGAGYSLMDTLISYLNEKQFDSGLWHEQINYYAVNGLMKISGVYSAAGVPIPNVERSLMAALDAITTDEEPTAVTSPYNTWFAVGRILGQVKKLGGDENERIARNIIKTARERAPEAIRMTKEKLSLFKKEDGSYSYCRKASSARSQGCPVTHENTNEGDINATIICSSDLLPYLYKSLDLSHLRAPIFTSELMERYISIIRENEKNYN